MYGGTPMTMETPMSISYKVGPPFTIAKLVQITPITMVYGTYNYSYWGESKPTYNWGASHCTDSGIGWWFGTPYIGNFIIPTDFHIFQRGTMWGPQDS